MRTLLLAFLASPLLLLACTATPPPSPFKPVASVKQLMKAIVIPSSDVVFHVAAKAPQDDTEWIAVQNSAMTLVESGNLLMIGSRAKDQGNWIKESQALVDAGLVAFKAAEAKDVEALTKVGDQIYEICESCHNRYQDKSGKAQ